MKMTGAALVRVLLAVALAAATAVHDSRAQECKDCPQPGPTRGLPTDSDNRSSNVGWYIAGGIVLASVLGSALVPQLKWVAAAIGGGLTFAAVSNSCAMGALLSRLPYNRRGADDPRAVVEQLIASR